VHALYRYRGDSGGGVGIGPTCSIGGAYRGVGAIDATDRWYRW